MAGKRHLDLACVPVRMCVISCAGLPEQRAWTINQPMLDRAAASLSGSANFSLQDIVCLAVMSRWI